MATKETLDGETTEVLICGGGPTGTLLSAYLGRMSVKNVVLEKEAEIPPLPRAFSLFDDGIRHLQGLGLYGFVYSEIGMCENLRCTVSEGETLTCCRLRAWFVHRRTTTGFT